MNIARLSIAGLLGALTTLALVLLMSSLISQEVKAPDEDGGEKIADIHMPDRLIETQYEEKPEKPEEPEEQPDMPEPEFDTPELNPDAINIAAPQVTPNLQVKGIGGFGGDGEYLPIVKVNPTYPSRALSRGIEGFVIVEFTVTTNGSVRDPFVVEAFSGRNGNLAPSTIFNSSALKAALKFKYKPRVIDGDPVEVPGVRNKITFAIAK